MMVSEVSGAFTDYSGMVTYDPADPDAFQAQATIKAASVDTRNTMRDEHIRGNDYLATDQYPDILFKSRGLNKSDQNYVLVGDLTIRDVTKNHRHPGTDCRPRHESPERRGGYGDHRRDRH